jgi:hypothetical protein
MGRGEGKTDSVRSERVPSGVNGFDVVGEVVDAVWTSRGRSDRSAMDRLYVAKETFRKVKLTHAPSVVIPVHKERSLDVVIS